MKFGSLGGGKDGEHSGVGYVEISKICAMLDEDLFGIISCVLSYADQADYCCVGRARLIGFSLMFISAGAEFPSILWSGGCFCPVQPSLYGSAHTCWLVWPTPFPFGSLQTNGEVQMDNPL